MSGDQSSSSASSLGETQLNELRNSISLLTILQNGTGHQLFEQHLAQEYSTENLTFYDRSGYFETLEPDEQLIEATSIVNEFITDQSPTQINIPARMCKELLAQFQAGDINAQMFQPARQEIFALMAADSFKRFKASPRFLQFLDSIDISTIPIKPASPARSSIMDQPVEEVTIETPAPAPARSRSASRPSSRQTSRPSSRQMSRPASRQSPRQPARSVSASPSSPSALKPIKQHESPTIQPQPQPPSPIAPPGSNPKQRALGLKAIQSLLAQKKAEAEALAKKQAKRKEAKEKAAREAKLAVQKAKMRPMSPVTTTGRMKSTPEKNPSVTLANSNTWLEGGVSSTTQLSYPLDPSVDVPFEVDQRASQRATVKAANAKAQTEAAHGQHAAQATSPRTPRTARSMTPTRFRASLTGSTTTTTTPKTPLDQRPPFDPTGTCTVIPSAKAESTAERKAKGEILVQQLLSSGYHFSRREEQPPRSRSRARSTPRMSNSTTTKRDDETTAATTEEQKEIGADVSSISATTTTTTPRKESSGAFTHRIGRERTATNTNTNNGSSTARPSSATRYQFQPGTGVTDATLNELHAALAGHHPTHTNGVFHDPNETPAQRTKRLQQAQRERIEQHAQRMREAKEKLAAAKAEIERELAAKEAEKPRSRRASLGRPATAHLAALAVAKPSHAADGEASNGTTTPTRSRSASATRTKLAAATTIAFGKSVPLLPPSSSTTTKSHLASPPPNPSPPSSGLRASLNLPAHVAISMASARDILKKKEAREKAATTTTTTANTNTSTATANTNGSTTPKTRSNKKKKTTTASSSSPAADSTAANSESISTPAAPTSSTTVEPPAEGDIVYPNQRFRVDDLIYATYGDNHEWFLANVLKAEKRNDLIYYYVHYQGFNDKFNDWRPYHDDSELMKYDEESTKIVEEAKRQRKAALQTQQVVEAPVVPPEAAASEQSQIEEIQPQQPAAESEVTEPPVDEAPLHTDTITDHFLCDQCGGRNCSYFQMQTSTADVPMTTFVTCHDCGYKWREGDSQPAEPTAEAEEAIPVEAEPAVAEPQPAEHVQAEEQQSEQANEAADVIAPEAAPEQFEDAAPQAQEPETIVEGEVPVEVAVSEEAAASSQESVPVSEPTQSELEPIAQEQTVVEPAAADVLASEPIESAEPAPPMAETTAAVEAAEPTSSAVSAFVDPREQLPEAVERQPLVHEQAPVSTKVAAFNEWFLKKPPTEGEETANQPAVVVDQTEQDVTAAEPVAAPAAPTIVAAPAESAPVAPVEPSASSSTTTVIANESTLPSPSPEATQASSSPVAVSSTSSTELISAAALNAERKPKFLGEFELMELVSHMKASATTASPPFNGLIFSVQEATKADRAHAFGKIRLHSKLLLVDRSAEALTDGWCEKWLRHDLAWLIVLMIQEKQTNGDLSSRFVFIEWLGESAPESLTTPIKDLTSQVERVLRALIPLSLSLQATHPAQVTLTALVEDMNQAGAGSETEEIQELNVESGANGEANK